MLFGAGPKFIMAEPGTDPLNEPQLYRVRRARGGINWWLVLFGLCIIASIAFYFIYPMLVGPR